MKAEHYRAFYRRRGLDAETAESILDRSTRYQSLTGPLPFSFRRVIEGDTLRLGSRAFQIVTGGGHAPEQVMLYSPDDRILFAADQIMLSITPNVSVSPRNPTGDVLGLFIASLKRMAVQFDDDILVLPGHHRPFKGLRTRVREVTEHHDDRLGRIVSACAQAPRSAADLLKTLFRWPLDRGVMALAFGESCAHVNRLLEDRRITAEIEADGVERYTA
jgi:glyoxylase-like metal-dependent hydrolase (beta-lactamase superfamily II)